VNAPAGVAIDAALLNNNAAARNVDSVAEVAEPVVVDVQVHELVVPRNEFAAPADQGPVTRSVSYLRILDANMMSRAAPVSDLHRIVDDVVGVDGEAVDDYVAIV
jgi:hypothetical protein